MDLKSFVQVVQYLAVVILFIEFIFALCQRPSHQQKYVMGLTLACLLMFMGYNIELEAKNLQEALTGTAVSYIGKPYVMLFSFLFIASFYGKKFSKTFVILASVYCSLFCLLVFYNDTHHLYYATTDFVLGAKYSCLVITRGPLYFSYIITAVAFFLGCLYLIIDGTRKSKSIEKRKLTIWIILMVISGIGGYAFYLLTDTNGYDTTMIGVFGGVICLFILFTRYRVFDAVSIAQEFALSDSKTGLVVLDNYKDVLYTNDSGEYLLEEIGLDQISSIDLEDTLIVNDRVYNIRKKDIEINGKDFGDSYEINDITYSYNYQSRLEADVKARTEQIDKIKNDVIGSIASVVEARSIETGEHIIRTKEYVELMAKGLRKNNLYTDILTDEYISLLIKAAPLHDIGKIAVPDKILNKPSKLNAAEFKKMKVHSTIGAQIIEKTMRGLESDDYVEVAKEVALYHHEWWDGSGYPNKLAKTQIPLSARIMAIADTYDALVSERCYKPAYDSKKALGIIKEEAGTHFDPQLAKLFISIMKNDKKKKK